MRVFLSRSRSVNPGSDPKSPRGDDMNRYEIYAVLIRRVYQNLVISVMFVRFSRSKNNSETVRRANNKV